MGELTLKLIITYITPFILHYLIVSCNEQITNGMPSNTTHGKIIEMKIGEFHTAQPIQLYSNTISTRCILAFSSESKILSMNVIGKDHLNVTCQMFEKQKSDKGEDGGVLIKRNGSTYYEKSAVLGYAKASESIVDVETKDEKPGIVYFQQPTGFYKIKLNHVQGHVSCTSTGSPSHFGCDRGSDYFVNYIALVKGFRGTVFYRRSDVFEFDIDWKKTSYVITSRCFYLVQGYMYSFWYVGDLINVSEYDNSGKTSFEFLVKPCHH